MVTVMPDGKKGFVAKDQANACWDESDTRDVIGAIRQAPASSVLVTDCEIPMHVVESALRAARHLGVKVVLDPSPADRVTALLLSLADIVTPDAHEAEALTGIECEDVAAGDALHRGRSRRCRCFDRGRHPLRCPTIISVAGGARKHACKNDGDALAQRPRLMWPNARACPRLMDE